MSDFWKGWLAIWCVVNIGLGALLAAAAVPGLRTPTLLLLDLAFWPIDGQPAALSREAVLGLALCGTVLIGWGTLMLGLVRDQRLSRDPSVWRLMTAGVVVWYVIDSTISVALGAGVNALSNTLFLITFLIPVVSSGAMQQRSPAA